MTPRRYLVPIVSLSVVLLVALFFLVLVDVDMDDSNGTENLDANSSSLPVTLTPIELGTMPLINGSINLTHQADRYTNGPYEIVVYPAPDTNLPHEAYNRGILYDEEEYNICVYSEVLIARTCALPSVFNVTPDPDCRMLEQTWAGTDFRGYIHLYLDGRIISGGHVGGEGSLEARDPLTHDGFVFCYEMPLEIGTHTMRYVFEWEEMNILDTAEWEFTLTP